MESVPPSGYGGTERVVHELVEGLVARGHDVTVFASGDSDVAGRLVTTVDEALRTNELGANPMPWFLQTLRMILGRATDFDVIHSHLDWWGVLLAECSPVPVVSTFHGRLDVPWSTALLEDPPPGLVAISESQASAHPQVPWTVIHNGLSLQHAPFERRAGHDLCFVGRVDPEKGIVDAIEIARRSGRRLRIAAKVGITPDQRAYYEEVFRPALAAAGRSVEYLGELGRADRDRLFAESCATLMPGIWPEPFGLVAIESLACGTPVLARRSGALPEIIEDGVDGFFGSDSTQFAFLVERLPEIDRGAIRERVLRRFSADRMTDAYEALYRDVVRTKVADPAEAAAVSDGRPMAPPGETIGGNGGSRRATGSTRLAG
jgi:glycosyltransferase involved in cell wall biosynthesis